MKNFTTEEIIETLEKADFVTKETTKTDNGIIKKGIEIYKKGSENFPVRPIIYYMDYNPLDEEKILSMAEDAWLSAQSNDVQRITDMMNPDFILSNVKIYAQKNSENKKSDLFYHDENTDIDYYLHITLNLFDGNGSITLKKEHIESLGISEEDLWSCAEENTKENYVYESMTEFMAKMMLKEGKITEEEFDEVVETLTTLNGNMKILTNASGYKGSGLLNTYVLHDICEAEGVKRIAILPSSIHELIIIPHFEDKDIEIFNQLVEQVTETEVAPEDALASRAFIYDYESCTLS